MSFGEPDSDGQEALQLHALTGEQARENFAAGELVLEGRTGQTATAGGAGIGRADRRRVLHRPVAAGHRRRRGGQGDRTGPVGSQPENPDKRFAGTFVYSMVLEVSHQHPLLGPGPHRRMVRDQAGHRRRRVAADQPGRAPDDVADLLAERHRLLQPGQHPASLGGRRRRRQYIGEQIAALVAAAGPLDDPDGYGQAVARTCSPTCCPT